MSPAESEDWKERLKALGIGRKRGKKKEKREDFLGKEEGGLPAAASGAPGSEAPRRSSFKEISLRNLQKVESGRRGEDLASSLLEENLLRILDRNVRYKDGELDIVALDGGTTVFVEVKRRRDSSLGDPAEAVTRTKRLRVVRAARRWLAAHPSRARSVRFDVVAVLGDPPAVTWIKNAFGADGGA
ncbi:MAG TPA: YraN family protein [Thermoanaerobaculia bacterium]|nr:YraN family protein [Thermoanaerobaculia bacterium]